MSSPGAGMSSKEASVDACNGHADKILSGLKAIFLYIFKPKGLLPLVAIPQGDAALVRARESRVSARKPGVIFRAFGRQPFS